MTQLVEVPLEGGGSILLEADEGLGVVRAGKPGEVVAKVEQTFEFYLDGVRQAAGAVIGKLREMAQEIDVELGIKLSAKAGVVIANSAAQANIVVTVRWKRDKAE
jgi:hypothetical protein